MDELFIPDLSIEGNNQFPLMNKDEPIWYPIEDIFYLSRTEEESLAATRLGSLKHFVNLPEAYGFLRVFGFELLGKSLLVNLNKILCFDTEDNAIFFDKDLNRVDSKLYVTKKAVLYIKSTIGSEYDIANSKKSIAYSPMTTRKNIIF